jgi:hypothetical protein
MKSGNPNFLEPSGLLQACNGTALVCLIDKHISTKLGHLPLPQLKNHVKTLYIFIYLADCTMFPHLPAPIQQTVQCFHIFLRPFSNYKIFLLHSLLSFQSSSLSPFSSIIPLIPSAQLSLGLPRFLLPDGRHFSTSFEV